MAYAAIGDLLARAGRDELVQVADRDGDGVADPQVVEAALLHADTTIDGYVAARYQVPLTAVPALVRTWAVAIARYWLHRDGAPEHVRRDFDDALASLKDAGRGTVVIPGADGIVPPAAGGGQVLSEIPAPVFTDESLRGWR